MAVPRQKAPIVGLGIDAQRRPPTGLQNPLLLSLTFPPVLLIRLGVVVCCLMGDAAGLGLEENTH